MDLYHLRTFVTVAEEKNLTRAARRLFMTPPSVSAHIKALEEELNITLFVRTSQGMEITEQGGILRVKAEETLRSAEELVNYATKMRAYLAGSIVMGLNATPRFLRIAQLAAQMRKDYPGIELSFVSSGSGKVIDRLQAKTMDAGFIFGPMPNDTLVAHRLHLADLVVAAPREWEEKIAKARWKELAALPWICSNSYCPFQTIIDKRFEQRNLKYQRVVQSDDEATKCALVCSGVGLALLEKSEAEEAAGAGKLLIWKREQFQCELSFVYLEKRKDDPLIIALEKEVLKSWMLAE